jgi:hypothetical protein
VIRAQELLLRVQPTARAWKYLIISTMASTGIQIVLSEFGPGEGEEFWHRVSEARFCWGSRSAPFSEIRYSR